MTPKPRKSLSSCITCEKCNILLTLKDLSLHETSCPPRFTETWNHSFISNKILYSTIEVYTCQEQPKNISLRNLDDMVFLSSLVLQSCEIAIGDPVVLTTKNNVTIKTAWPINEKSLFSVLLTKNAITLNNLDGLIKVEKLKHETPIAKDITIKPIGKQVLSNNSAELLILLKNYNELKIYCIGNKINIPFYGKKLIFEIIKVQPVGAKGMNTDFIQAFDNLNLLNDNTHQVRLYKSLYSTNWIIEDYNQEKNENKLKKSKYKIEDIGGYEDLITDIKSMIDIGLGTHKNIGEFNISKGILLYGVAGVGKSMMANAITSEYNIETFTIRSLDIYSKSIGETEKRLMEIFDKAKANSPCLVLLEDIDTVCPRRGGSNTDHERRVLACIVSFFDDLQETNQSVVVLATTSKLDYVDDSLRRPGRFDKEFEVCVPSPTMRSQILIKLLSKIPNELSEHDVSEISFDTHGFVGADLYGLCSQAIINAIKYKNSSKIDIKVSQNDFKQALIVCKPSAMKQVLVEIPNVKWTDVGGQKDLKLKLKQAIEWPLRYPEVFERMGITPPRGVLMFGPPGCSKTLIAKALATESKVNFLNIKGPELFSKWVGESEKAVREVFRKARQVAPSIVFIDEIDALGGERASSSASSGSNVQERVLAQLLTELDGITALGNVTLVAATNRPDRIDKALLRPGRLDRIIYVPLPNEETRHEVFNIKLRKMPIAKDVDIQGLVELTKGYSGAEIQAICHEAAMRALEENLNAIVVTQEHFKVALSIITPRTPQGLVKLYEDYMNKVY